MRKLSKKISMLMVLAMLVGLFSGVVSASAASAWSFASGKYDVAVNGSINMESKEYADFDLLKDGAAPAGYTVAWASSDEDVVWVNAKTGQLRANKFGKAADGDKAVISATFTNTATKKSATRSFTIVLGAAKADFTVEAADVTIALGEEVKFAPVVKDAAGNVVKFATHKSYNGYFLDGKAIANPWTPEEAGEYTVTVAQFAKKADVADLAKAVRKDEVKVTVTVDTDFDAKATGLKEITAYGDFAKDAKFTVKKGNQNVTATATIADDGKSAVLALGSKLRAGVYTVSCGDAKVEITCEDEKVASIVVLENGSSITTGKEASEAYAHYDVFNQYGESVRKNYSVTWTSSTGKKVGWDATTGELVIPAADKYVYGNTVILTGIHAVGGNVVPVDATMTIGLENCVGSVNVIGVVRKGTNEILSELPVEFVKDEYLLAFELLDRNGYKMKYDDKDVKSLTFTSFSPLLLEGFLSPSESALNDVVANGVTINGVQYGAIKLTPGLQAKNGGIANIKITSNKTGKQVDYALRVNCAQTLAEFKVIAPDSIIAKGDDDVTFAYEAYDTEGKPMTDFRALYQSVTFSSKLLRLVEKNDGTAELKYTVDPNAIVSEEYDYNVLYTVIIPQNGKASNVSFSIKNNRYVAGVSAYSGATNILEGSTLDVEFIKEKDWENGLSYYDQYDADRGWWQADLSNVLFAIKVSGKADSLEINGDTAVDIATLDKDKVNKDYQYFSKGNRWSAGKLQFIAKPEVTNSQESFLVEFALAKKNGEIISGSEKTAVFNIVDLNQCTGFTAGVQNGLIENGTDEAASLSVTGLLANGSTVSIPMTVKLADKSEKKIVEYSAWISAATGSATSVPAGGFNQVLVGNKLTSSLSEAKDYEKNFSQFEDLSAMNADGTRPGRKLTYYVTATITGIDGTLKDKVGASVEVAAYDRKSATVEVVQPWEAAWINRPTDAYVSATDGEISYEDFLGYIAKFVDNYGDDMAKFNYEDLAKAGEELADQIEVNITKLTEGNKGLYANSLVLNANGIKASKVDKNNKIDKTVMISGAEIGDTFTVTYKHVDGVASHTINFTVGADKTAHFYQSTDKLDWR